MKCKDCKFFRTGNMHAGECRIRAATIPYPTNASVRNKGLWPVVDQEDWCGEFKTKDNYEYIIEDCDDPRIDSLLTVIENYKKAYDIVITEKNRLQTMIDKEGDKND